MFNFEEYHRTLHINRLNQIRLRKNQFLEKSKKDVKKISPNNHCKE